MPLERAPAAKIVAGRCQHRSVLALALTFNSLDLTAIYAACCTRKTKGRRGILDPGKIRIAATLGIVLALSGCGWLPRSGPTTSKVISQATTNDGGERFVLIKVNDGVIDTLLSQPKSSFHSLFGSYGLPPPPTIAVGDTVIVTIWEAAGGTLFGQPLQVDHGMTLGSRGTAIPSQLVMRDGTISIPFAGRVAVVGRSTEAVAQAIQQRLNGKTVAPQVIVEVPSSPYHTVTVTGEVINGARVPLSPKGDRLLDMIAAAGGVKSPVFDTYVRLTRAGVTGTIPFSVLINTPAENIYAWPGDVLTLVHVQRNFEAFGATGKNAEINFDQEQLNLAQALGKSAGLLDERADPAGVFLLRLEPKSLVERLHGTLPPQSENRPNVPVVYRFNFDDTRSYFLAQRFPMEDKDVIYVANAEGDSIQKFLTILNTLTTPILTGLYYGTLIH